MAPESSPGPGATGTFNQAALDYFAAHAIDPEIAATLGIRCEGSKLYYAYNKNGDGTYERWHSLATGERRGPTGQGLGLWMPTGRRSRVWLSLEGEPDLAACESALRADTLPPPVAGLALAAIPGCGMPADRAAGELRGAGAEVVYTAFDGDDAGRQAAARIGESLREVGIEVLNIALPDGQDVADVLAAADDPTAELAELVAEAEAAAEVPSEGDAGGEDGDDALPVLPSPSAPMKVARALIEQLDLADQLRHHRGGWWEWKGAHWIESEDRGVRSKLYRAAEHATYLNGEGDLKPWAPNRQKIANLIEALAAIDHLHDQVDMPTWLDGREQVGPIVATANGLLDVDRRELLPHSPQFFNRVSVPFAFEADPPAPERWLAFLEELWPDDPESIAALQEFFGYVLSGRLDQHKILLLVGPTRAGKGVITRILGALIGSQNVAGPTLSSMGGNFGLAPLLGKPLAIVSDARLSGRNSQVVVERLLAISGEDAITVDRKYRDQWTGKLPCRFVIVSNELPQLGDASAAIANRFVPLVLGRSWLGKEDRSLEGDLRRELPGILTWALDGLERLYEQGRFTSPPSAEEALATLIDLASPTGAFLRERCELGAGAEVDVDDLWTAWKDWCDGAGQPPGTKAKLGRDLRAAQPQIRKARPRDGEDRRQVYLGVQLREAE